MVDRFVPLSVLNTSEAWDLIDIYSIKCRPPIEAVYYEKT